MATFPDLQNDLILRAVRGEGVEKVPVWCMRQAGRYLPEFRELRVEHDFFTVCRTPELVAKVTLQPIDRFNLDAAILFSDILVVPQAMGLQVDMVPGTGPVLPAPLATPSDLERLPAWVDVEQSLDYVFRAIPLTRTRLNGRVPLIGFSGAPWTLMCYMVDGKSSGESSIFKTTKTWLYKYPKESHVLLSKITQVVTDYLIGQARSGAQLLQVFDTWAGLLSPDLFKEFVLPYLTQISDSVKKAAPDVPLICFAKGAFHSIEDIAKSSYDVVGLDWTVDPRTARNLVGEHAALQGNLDPCVLYGEKNTIIANVQRMIDGFGTRRYIANLGHGLHPTHSVESVATFVDAVHNISEEAYRKGHQ